MKVGRKNQGRENVLCMAVNSRSDNASTDVNCVQKRQWRRCGEDCKTGVQNLPYGQRVPLAEMSRVVINRQYSRNTKYRKIVKYSTF